MKIVFRVGLVLLKQMLGSVDKLRELQGMYETMERLRNISPDTIREDILVQEVSAYGGRVHKACFCFYSETQVISHFILLWLILLSSLPLSVSTLSDVLLSRSSLSQ